MQKQRSILSMFALSLLVSATTASAATVVSTENLSDLRIDLATAADYHLIDRAEYNQKADQITSKANAIVRLCNEKKYSTARALAQSLQNDYASATRYVPSMIENKYNLTLAKTTIADIEASIVKASKGNQAAHANAISKTTQLSAVVQQMKL